MPIGELSAAHIRTWMIEMLALQHTGAISAKTINNARGALSGALGDAARRGLLVDNPCRHIAPLPIEHRELDYLRLAEIDQYLRACPAHY